ncbi:MAG TPA: hypothetical protein PLH07_02160 [Sulfurovum sp.]|nr:hypothetical protein [Sulfurovum sp.]
MKKTWTNPKITKMPIKKITLGGSGTAAEGSQGGAKKPNPPL